MLLFWVVMRFLFRHSLHKDMLSQSTWHDGGKLVERKVLKRADVAAADPAEIAHEEGPSSLVLRCRYGPKKVITASL